MPEPNLYEYAVLRLMPRVEREEFLNIGIVLYTHRPKTLHFLYEMPLYKLEILYPELDLQLIDSYLCTYQQICLGNTEYGTISTLPIQERFRWITATRSTMIQCSKIHSGFSTDIEVTVEKLMQELVA